LEPQQLVCYAITNINTFNQILYCTLLVAEMSLHIRYTYALLLNKTSDFRSTVYLILRVRPVSSKVKLWTCWNRTLYRQDALPVAQLTALKK